VQRVAALTRWQASYGRALPGGWQWRLRAENLTNTQRADGSAVLVAPGRTVLVEVGRW
jgi:outer membrane receptor protein involved in Fe transport